MALLTTVKPRNIDTTGDYVVNSISATGNVSANNIKTDHLLYANGSPYVFTTTAAGSNTQIQFNDANSFAGSANLTYNKTSKTLNVDNITVSGNITPSTDVTYDLGSNSHRFKDLFLSGNTLLIGDGAITIDGNSMVLTNPAGGTFVVDGSNAAYASIASYVTEGNQSNITQVGTLTSLNVSGNITAGNIKTDNLLHSNGVAYTIASFTNDAGYLTSANLSSYATQTYVNTAIANVIDAAPAALDTLKELATALGNDASYATTITNALANKLSTSSFTSTADTWLATKSTTNLSEGTNQYYTVARANTAIDNRVTKTFVDNLGVVASVANTVVGANVTGEVAFANVANNVAGANVSGQVGNSLVSGTVYASSQPNITSVGTLTGLTVSGNIIPSANVTYNLGNSTNRFKDLYLSGTTIDLSGTLIQVASNGQINVGNATFTSTGTFGGNSITGEVAFANVANNVAGANVSGQVGNALVAGTVYTAAQPNITSVGTLTSLTVSGNVTAGNIKSDHLLYANGTAYTLASFTNDTGYLVSSNLSGYATQTYVNSAVANLVNSAPTALDTLQELANALGNDASYSTTITNALANKLSTSAFTSTADTWLGTKSTTNLAEGTNQYYTVARANTAIDARVTKSFVDALGVIAGSASSVAVANVTGIGNIATINKDGNASNILYGNGSFAAAPVTYGDSNVASYLPTYTGALSSSNLTVSVGNLHITGGTANYVLKTDGAGNLSWIAQSGGSQSNISVTTDTFTGDGTTTVFLLSATPGSKDQTLVNYNGAMQLRSAYSLSGANITFSEAPASGSTIEVTTTSGVTSASGTFVYRQYTGDGTTTQFAVSSSCDANSILVTQNGVMQAPILDYSVSTGTLTFLTAPNNGERIQVREMKTAISTASTGASLGKTYAINMFLGF